jgi:hypothetical protein
MRRNRSSWSWDPICHWLPYHAIVSDEPFYSPYLRPQAPRQPRRGELVWTLLKAGKRVDCELRFHGVSYGWECQCLYDGDFVYGRRFLLRAGALNEAEAQRRRLMGEGWIDM